MQLFVTSITYWSIIHKIFYRTREKELPIKFVFRKTLKYIAI